MWGPPKHVLPNEIERNKGIDFVVSNQPKPLKNVYNVKLFVEENKHGGEKNGCIHHHKSPLSIQAWHEKRIDTSRWFRILRLPLITHEHHTAWRKGVQPARQKKSGIPCFGTRAGAICQAPKMDAKKISPTGSASIFHLWKTTTKLQPWGGCLLKKGEQRCIENSNEMLYDEGEKTRSIGTPQHK